MEKALRTGNPVQGYTIGVEVTLLHNTEGWGTTRERAFEHELGRLIKEASKEGEQRWHARCEYDPRYLGRHRKKIALGRNASVALRSPYGGEFQLLSEGDMGGRGVVLGLDPASNEGSFVGVSVDEGCAVEATLPNE